MTWLEFKRKISETTSRLTSDAVPITFLHGETEIRPTDITVECEITGDRITLMIDLKENKSDLADDVREVLQTKLRNCEVGTPAEQMRRFEEYCQYRFLKSSCSGCPLNDNNEDPSCFDLWLQLPYEEKRNENPSV